MFSPDPAHGTLPARNPRRRQRTSEESASTKQTTKRRKRSSLTTDTFDPLSKLHSDGLAKLVNGHTVKREPDQDTQSQHDAPVDATSLAIRHRGSKRGEKDKRGSRVEDGIVQVFSDSRLLAAALKLTSKRRLKTITTLSPRILIFQNSFALSLPEVICPSPGRKERS
jgi:hypothetical protein